MPMRVFLHRHFEKQLRKLPKSIQLQFVERLTLFLDNPSNPLLRVHLLSGEKYPLESMNVSADYRALFIRNKETITFYEIGTHSELY